MKPWKYAKPPVVQKVGWRNVVHKVFVDPDGIEREYSTIGLCGRSSVATIGLTSEYKVVLARQFRAGPEKILDELPGGGMEDGETYEQAARREFAEETGYEAGEMHFLGEQLASAYDNTSRQYFIAFNCKPSASGQKTDDGEYVQPIEVTIDDLFNIAKSGKMTDVGAVFLAYEQLKALNKELNIR